jgi:NAD(P)-dependent dehydrogenase (short-subunit alcohol dehydrogenase family)
VRRVRLERPVRPARPLALVTGGSSGIGLELARQFAQHGYDVAIWGQSGLVFNSADILHGLGVEAYPIKVTPPRTTASRASGSS